MGLAEQKLLQVISGQQLPKVDKTKEGSIVDPLVRVEIFGVRPDTTRQETSYVENNGETGQCWGGGGRSMTVTFLTSCPSFSIVHVTTILLPPPWEAVWNRTKNQGLDIFSLNPGLSIIRSSN